MKKLPRHSFIRQSAISNRQSAQPYASVAAFSLLIIDDGLEQIRLGKVRPKGFRHPKLRVGGLPEEEIAQAQFAAGPNEQVRIRQITGIKMAAQSGFVNGYVPILFCLRQELADRIDEFSARAIVERQGQAQPGILPCAFERTLEVALHGFRQFVNSADDRKANILPVEFRNLLL